MTNTNLFKMAHSMAKVMTDENKRQGFTTNYQANFSLAIKLIKGNRLNEAIQIIEVIEGKREHVTPEKQEEKQPKQRKVTKKKAEKEEQAEFSLANIHEALANVESIAGKKASVTIETLILNSINGVTIGEGEKAKKLNGWDKLTGEHKQAKVFQVTDAIEAYRVATTFQQLQGITIALIIDDITKRMIHKYLTMGIHYKKLDQREESVKAHMFAYENAPSSDDSINDIEVTDVFDELVIRAYEGTFSNQMFEETGNVFTSVYFRISNEIRRLRGKSQTRIARELVNNGYETMTCELDTNIDNQIDFLSDKEKALLEGMLQGYKIKEMEEMTGQRLDRPKKHMRNKLEEMSGMTIKQAKAEQKSLIEKQKKAKAEMLERKRQAMIEELPERNIEDMKQAYKIAELNNMNHAKTLKKPNTEMIDKMDMLQKQFHSKAII